MMQAQVQGPLLLYYRLVLRRRRSAVRFQGSQQRHPLLAGPGLSLVPYPLHLR